MDILLTAVTSGFFAGVVTIGVTLVIEKLGGRIGGTIGASPTTILPVSFGVMAIARHEPERRQLSLLGVAGAMVSVSFYLLAWRFLPFRIRSTYTKMRRMGILIALSLLIWAFVASLIVPITKAARMAHINPWIPNIICTAIVFVNGLTAVLLNPPPSPRGKRPVSLLVLLGRGFAGSTGVMVGVVVTHFSPLIGPFVSLFPAMLTTTMVALWLSQDEAVPTGAAGPMAFGLMSTTLYASFFELSIEMGVPPLVLPYFIAYFGAVLLWSLPSMGFLVYLAKRKSAYAALEDQKEMSMEGVEDLNEVDMGKGFSTSDAEKVVVEPL